MDQAAPNGSLGDRADKDLQQQYHRDRLGEVCENNAWQQLSGPRLQQTCADKILGLGVCPSEDLKIEEVRWLA